MFFMNKNKKKNLILFHLLFLSHITIIWNCLSSVYVPSFSLSLVWWNRVTAYKIEVLFNHFLKLENICVYILETLLEFSVLIRTGWECFFSHPLFITSLLLFKKCNLNFNSKSEHKRREKKNRQNLLPSNYMYQESNKIIRAHKSHKSILYFNLQIKNFSSLSHSSYIHIKNILKKLKENCHHRYCCFYSHTHTISMFLFSGHDARLLEWERIQ
jgi:hypothetical protein